MYTCLSAANESKGDLYMKRITLGIHVGHDRGACIIINREVKAMISQERLDRIKYSQSPLLPYEAIDSLLRQCKLHIDDISCVGLSFVAADKDRLLQYYKEAFFTHYDCEYIPFYWVNHHDAHAYSAYFSSGFQDSLIFISDGGGDVWGAKQEAETLYTASNGVITRVDQRLQDMCIRHMQDPINHMFPYMPEIVQNSQLSIGRKYAQITHFLGFSFGESGKTMGLASYGESLFDFTKQAFDGLNFSLTYADIIQDIHTLQTLSGNPYQDFIYHHREDIASTVQSFTEHILVSLVKSFSQKYKFENLCLSGGVFLNCLTNHKILEKCNIRNLFIPPCAGDDGQAQGAAYYADIQQFGPKQPFSIKLPYLGLEYTDEEIHNAIEEKNLSYTVLAEDSLASLLAKEIADNKIIALHRGRTEIGPRALCHRSILANPTNPHMKDILNRRVKHREVFRPFAPTVTSEDQFVYFDLKDQSNFMLYATTVKEAYRRDLAAITHVDSTARIQAISKESDSFMHCLLLEMKRRTGYPIVLNTSFNVAGKPIVETPLDAINTFLSTEIDILVIGNNIVYK